MPEYDSDVGNNPVVATITLMISIGRWNGKAGLFVSAYVHLRTDCLTVLVLRVFGIYTHAQLDARLWDSISSQLSRRGKEYRRR